MAFKFDKDGYRQQQAELDEWAEKKAARELNLEQDGYYRIQVESAKYMTSKKTGQGLFILNQAIGFEDGTWMTGKDAPYFIMAPALENKKAWEKYTQKELEEMDDKTFARFEGLTVAEASEKYWNERLRSFYRASCGLVKDMRTIFGEEQVPKACLFVRESRSWTSPDGVELTTEDARALNEKVVEAAFDVASKCAEDPSLFEGAQYYALYEGGRFAFITREPSFDENGEDAKGRTLVFPDALG